MASSHPSLPLPVTPRITVTSAQLSPHSGAASAAAVLQTAETGGVCIIVILSVYRVGPASYCTMYVNVEFKEGNVEQTISLRKCPPDCKHALDQLIRSPGFHTAVIAPVVKKVKESQQAHGA